jgi:FdhD protein
LKADAVPAGAVAIAALARRDGRVQPVSDFVADEVPVALQYNGISHAVMLCSPRDLEDFALGFSLSEGLIDTPADLRGVEAEFTPQGWVLELEIATRCEVRLKERRRTLAGRTGCGLCGTESLDQALPAVGAGVVQPRPVRAAAVAQAMHGLREQQALARLTGATHAAGWCSAEGEVQLLREDVGRHNALDKLVGALARAGTAAAEGFAVVTSRASYEMVQKTARAGIGLLAAISAPTALAIRTAEAAGLTLLGFARGTDWVAYSHVEQLILD